MSRRWVGLVELCRNGIRRPEYTVLSSTALSFVTRQEMITNLYLLSAKLGNHLEDAAINGRIRLK